jgi:ankyrin repeat protein
MVVIVRELIENGAALNVKDSRGVTALLLAVNFANFTGYMDIVKELLEAKADPNIRTDSGCSPLGLVNERRTSNTSQLAQLLKQYGGQ